MLAVYNGFSFTVEEEAEFWNAFSTDWELDKKALSEKYTAPDKSIIDVGAWIGPTVLIGYANNAKHIYAIEADPANAHILKKNCMRNFIADRVTIITRCMYPVSNETISFGKCLLQGSGASSTKTFGGSAKVLSSTLIDSIIDNNINLDEVNILKIDIEGAELLLV